MKVFAISKIVACTLLLGTAAYGSDLPRRDAAPMPIPTLLQKDWSGFYAGLHAGHSWGRDHTAEFFTATGAFTGLQWRYSADSFLGGVHAGYLHQFSRIVLGIEVDADIANASGGFVDPPALPLNPGGSGRLTNTWRASVRGTVGYAMGNVLPYITGGLAVADLKYRYGNGTTGASEVTKSNRTGYTLGAGISYAINQNLRVTVEYRHTNFGDFFYPSQVAFPGILTGRQSPRFDSVRAKISYQF